jgi:hypothetical protein
MYRAVYKDLSYNVIIFSVFPETDSPLRTTAQNNQATEQLAA